MSALRQTRLLLLLLPFLVARALLPAGFMPAMQDGQVQLAFCSVAFAPAGDDAPQPMAGDDHCPFAQPAMAALPVLPSALPADSTPRVFHSAVEFFQPTTGPPRTSGSRAPPVLFSA